MDAIERLVFDSEAAVAVLGCGEDFLLVPLTELPISDVVMEDGVGFKFRGVLALLNGCAAAKCEPDLDTIGTMLLAAAAFGAQLGERLKCEQREGDSVAWLERPPPAPGPMELRVYLPR